MYKKIIRKYQVYIQKKTTPKRIVAQALRFKLYCPICKTYMKTMKPYGLYSRENAQCRGCGSLERYRWLHIWLKRKTDIYIKRNRLLEVAPNSSLYHAFKKHHNIDYWAVNISYEALTDVTADLCRLPFRDSMFDFIILMQILEHVKEETKALLECHRILKPQGRCIITVPIDTNRMETIMNPHLSSTERLDCYGQEDHIRIYGTDISDKLNSTGFGNIMRVAPDTVLSEHEMKSYSIKTSYPFHDYQTCDDLFVCTK